jgi:uncharacterized integral membrane protein (TIGR00698 family)|tara:strand:+ start:1472 stop:2503 length:1032 start_codon:yes stop_codon:yes gene_type:complete
MSYFKRSFCFLKATPFGQHLTKVTSGFLLCLMVAMSAKFVSEHYGGPVILYALLMGIALNYLSTEGRCVAGIEFCSKSILRFGIALLGARITIEQLMGLGITPIIIVLVSVPSTILFGFFVGRWLKLGRSQSILSGSAVGICGASAALAVAAVLPYNKHAEKNLIFTVVCVTALSTVAMIAYPLIVTAFNMNPTASGVFLGATIHDVAQVVGAGYMMSDEIGDTATFTKLLRVSTLVPVVLIIALIAARWGKTPFDTAPSGFPLPIFLVAFIIIVSINSAGFIVPEAASFMVEMSRWCLILAMVGLGMKSSFKELAAMGWRPIALMVAETIFLAGLVLTCLQF